MAIKVCLVLRSQGGVCALALSLNAVTAFTGRGVTCSE